MRILFTGISSFTGFWFARTLLDGGHEIVAPLARKVADYEGVRARRAELLRGRCRMVEDCPFGSDAFLREVRAAGHFDVLCHHAADVTDYKSRDFDYLRATAANCRQARAVLGELRDRGCRVLVATGSVFEADEGAGEKPLRAFSPYGLSKTLTWQILRYEAGAAGLETRKFVIPNPVGAYEEPRFSTYLATSWLAGRVPSVKTPAYVRDNVPVTLLALAYRSLVERPHDPATAVVSRSPGFWAETQGAFAERMARALAPRLGVACPLRCEEQTVFEEPRVRIGAEPLDAGAHAWNEPAWWDELAEYYRANVSPA